MGFEFEPLSHRIIEAAIDVHRELGPGFIESIYHRALEVALREAGLFYETEKEIRVYFAGVDVGCHRLDLVVEKQIVVEVKAVKAFEDIFFVKLKSYLKATGLHVGLLLNFSSATLTVKRVVY
jgi:GxxExxY protein